VSDPITTRQLIDGAEERTGLPREQLLIMVAKSAAVRHVATHAGQGPLLVLKGGTLLTHVYKSPRQSIADVDYLHLEPDTINAPEIEQALTLQAHKFSMETTLGFKVDKFEGKGEFSFDDIEVDYRARRLTRRRELKITVSVKPGERLDPPAEPLFYEDRMLFGVNQFEIEGLTLNELAAEKLLGWCSKALPKHLVDLAYVAREWGHTNKVDAAAVADLVKRKFALEGGSPRYQKLGIRHTADLPARFTDTRQIKTQLHDIWSDLADDQLFFHKSESAEPADLTLTDPRNIERIALDYWEQTIRLL
jgi:predicted nucleotidyltransferase component of viral defense system